MAFQAVKPLCPRPVGPFTGTAAIYINGVRLEDVNKQKKGKDKAA